MKSTGMVRKIDELGRIVMPAEIRQTLGLQVRDAMEIYIDGDRIVLKKYQPSCIFCSCLPQKKTDIVVTIKNTVSQVLAAA